MFTCHRPQRSWPPSDTTPGASDIASLPVPSMPTPAHLPPRPTTLTHPHQLWPVLPAPGWGLRARAASLSTSTRSQSSARMVEARTRPRPAAVPARLGRRGPPGWPAEGWAAERQRSAGQASSESGGAPAGGERAERPPGAGTGEGAGRGGGAAPPELAPSLPQPSQPCPSAPRELPRPLPRRGERVAGGGRGQGGEPSGWENPRRASATPTPHLSFCLPSPPPLPGGKRWREGSKGQIPGRDSGRPFLRPCAPTIHTRPISTRLPDFLGCCTELCRDLMPIPTPGVSPCSRGLNSTPSYGFSPLYPTPQTWGWRGPESSLL